MYANFLLAFGAAALTYGYADIFGAPNKSIVFWLVFNATLFIYNAQRLFRYKSLKAETLSYRQTWLVEHRKYIILITLFSGAISFVLIMQFYFSLYTFLVLGFAGALGGFYAFKFKHFGFPLRDIPYMKIHFIALSWTLTVVLWPAIIGETTIIQVFPYFFGNYFIFMALIIPFDIRDLDVDEQEKKTIPQIFGVLGAKMLAIMFAVLSGIIFYTCQSFSLFRLIMLITPLILLIIFTQKQAKEWYFSVLLDAWILFYAINLYF